MQYRYIVAAILLACYLPAAAQTLPRVEVTGSLAAQRKDDVAPAAVVGRDELLRHGDRSVLDALRRVPGLTVGTRVGDIRLRGLGNGYTTVLLNGSPLPPAFSLEALAPDMIERVEVVRGASADLAAQGVAGTINIVLRRQATGARARNEARLGLDSTRGMVAPSGGWQWGGQGDGVDWTLNGAITHTAQPETSASVERGDDGAGTPSLLRHGTGWVDNKSRAASLSPRIAWKRPGGSVAWQGFINLARRGSEEGDDETTLLGKPNDFPANGARLDVRGVLLRSETTWQQQLADGVKGNARLVLSHYPRRSEFAFYRRDGARRQPDARRVRSDVRESTLAGSGKLEFAAADGHTVLLGWDAEAVRRSQSRNEQDFDAATTSDDRYRGAIGRAALFAQDEWTITPAWSLSAGLRWETLRTEVTPRGGAPVAQRGTVASPLLQTLYKASPDTRWRAGLTRTYKAPGMPELVPRRYTVDNGNSQTNPDNQGNPLLRPELARGLDAGYERTFDSGAGAGSGTLSAGAYKRWIDQVQVPLLFRDGARWVRTPANLGRAEVWGVALEARLALSSAWSVRGNVSRDHSRVMAAPGPDNRLARQAPKSAGAGFDYRHGGALVLGADMAWQSGGWSRESALLAVLGAPQRKLDAYLQWNASRETRLRFAVSGLLRRDAHAGALYTGDDGARVLAVRTHGWATMRVNVEHRW